MYIGKSQTNEEIIINEIFKKLNIKKGKFFEIGVNNLNIDGTIECNSLNLMKQGTERLERTHSTLSVLHKLLI